MAAFFGLGIDNARVELDAPRSPSWTAAPLHSSFCCALRAFANRKAQNVSCDQATLEIHDGGRSVRINPSKSLKISFAIDFNHPLLRDQAFDLSFSGKDFIKEISRARTFGFLRDISDSEGTRLGSWRFPGQRHCDR